MSGRSSNYTPIYKDQKLADIEWRNDGRTLAMLGTGGPPREEAAVTAFLQNNQDKLPVLLGAGLGFALKKLLNEYTGPIAIVDKEKDLLELTQVKANLSEKDLSRIIWLNDENSKDILAQLTRWQVSNGCKPLYPLPLTFYLRRDKDYYGALRQNLELSAKFDFWAKVRHPRFQNNKPRILLIGSGYFLFGEVERACARLGLDYELFNIEDICDNSSNSKSCKPVIDSGNFVKSFLETVLRFKPDCAVTLNHLGVDREGLLMDLLAQLNLPLASWFVDNPHLIIHLYKACISPWTALFTWDEDNISTLKDFGFPYVSYLPLGTDIERFSPANPPGPAKWRSRVSFVGNSMYQKVALRLKTGHFPASMLRPFKNISAEFSKSEDRSVADFLRNNYPEVYTHYMGLSDNEAKLAYETAITWQATKLYRNYCVRQLLPYKPLIVGDKGWNIEFRHDNPKPRLLPAISYYTELPNFYGMSEINFNCTSKQMKGAVNQRIFDAPAAGAFVLTDWRPQMANLFNPDEIACYNDPAEIGQLSSFYLKNPSAREKIVKKARKRILKEHKWEDRIKTILEKMREIYGTKV